MSAKALSFGGSGLSGIAGFFASAAGVCAVAGAVVGAAGFGCRATSHGGQRRSNEKRKPVRFFIWSTPFDLNGENDQSFETPRDRSLRPVGQRGSPGSGSD